MNETKEIRNCWFDNKADGKFNEYFACLDFDSTVHFGYIPEKEAKPYFFSKLEMSLNNNNTKITCYDIEKISNYAHIVDCSYTLTD